MQSVRDNVCNIPRLVRALGFLEYSSGSLDGCWKGKECCYLK